MDETHHRCVRSSPNCSIPFAGRPGTGANFVYGPDQPTYYSSFFQIVESNFVVREISGSYNCKTSKGNIFDITSAGYAKCIRVIAHDGYCQGVVDGFRVGDNSGQELAYCMSYGNSGSGFYRTFSTNTIHFICCTAINNKQYGFTGSGNHTHYNCYAKGNKSGDFNPEWGWNYQVHWNASNDGTLDGLLAGIGMKYAANYRDITTDAFGRPLSGEVVSGFVSGEYFGRSPYPRYVYTVQPYMDFFSTPTKSFNYSAFGYVSVDPSESYNYRVLISGEDLLHSGENTFVVLEGYTGYAHLVHASIGERSGESWEFATAPTELTFGGRQDWELTEPSVEMSKIGALSEPVNFHIEPGTDYLIHMMFSGEHSRCGKNVGRMASAYSSGETDYTLSQEFPYSGLTAIHYYVSTIYLDTFSGEVSGEVRPYPDWNYDVVGNPQSMALDAEWSVGAAAPQDWELSGEVEFYQSPIEILRDMSGETKQVEFYQSPIEILRDMSGETKLVDFYQSPIEILRGYPKTRAYQSVVEVMSCFSGENIGKLYQMPVEVLSSRSQAGGANTSRMFVISS